MWTSDPGSSASLLSIGAERAWADGFCSSVAPSLASLERRAIFKGLVATRHEKYLEKLP